jgi:hypothetical protein
VLVVRRVWRRIRVAAAADPGGRERQRERTFDASRPRNAHARVEDDRRRSVLGLAPADVGLTRQRRRRSGSGERVEPDAGQRRDEPEPARGDDGVRRDESEPARTLTNALSNARPTDTAPDTWPLERPRHRRTTLAIAARFAQTVLEKNALREKRAVRGLHRRLDIMRGNGRRLRADWDDRDDEGAVETVPAPPQSDIRRIGGRRHAPDEDPLALYVEALNGKATSEASEARTLPPPRARRETVKLSMPIPPATPMRPRQQTLVMIDRPLATPATPAAAIVVRKRARDAPERPLPVPFRGTAPVLLFAFAVGMFLAGIIAFVLARQ